MNPGMNNGYYCPESGQAYLVRLLSKIATASLIFSNTARNRRA